MATFERVPAMYAAFTGKIASRQDVFMPKSTAELGYYLLEGEEAAAEDFMAKLRVVFGEPDRMEYVLWHRTTGLIVTAYSAQSGPSYGGGHRFLNELPKTVAPDHEEEVARQRRRRTADARSSSEELRELGMKTVRAARDGDLEAVQRLCARRVSAWRRFASLVYPEGYAETIECLENLIANAR